MMLSSITQTRDFVILGPALAKSSKHRVLEAIHALYYLPDNFKMVFTGWMAVEKDIYDAVVALVERDALAERVHFASGVGVSHAIVLPNRAVTEQPEKAVGGESAEALASAILDLARAGTGHLSLV
jgi:hypothetical protein